MKGQIREWASRVLALQYGTDTGNNTFMPFGELHARELEIFVTYCGFTPMEAIVAATRDNALAVGLPDDLGVLEAGRLADIIVVTRDPLADIRVLQGGRHLARVIKDGKLVEFMGGPETAPQPPQRSERRGGAVALLEFAHPAEAAGPSVTTPG